MMDGVQMRGSGGIVWLASSSGDWFFFQFCAILLKHFFPNFMQMVGFERISTSYTITSIWLKLILWLCDSEHRCIYQRIVICGFSRPYLFGTHKRNLINWAPGDFSWTGGKRAVASNYFSFDKVIESCILRHYDLCWSPHFLENKVWSLKSQISGRWSYKTMMKETTRRLLRPKMTEEKWLLRT